MKDRVPQSHCSLLVVLLLCCTVDNKYDWHLENHFSQISTVPTWSSASYPTRSFEDFTSSFDPLAINQVNQLAIQKQSPISEGALDEAMERCHYESVVRSYYPGGTNLAPINANGLSIVIDANHLFIQKQSPISEGALDEAGRLGKSTSMTLPSCLSSMERCHYESVVRSYYPGANFAPINANGVFIVIDAGASCSLSSIRADFTTLRKMSRRMHGISVETNIEGEGMFFLHAGSRTSNLNSAQEELCDSTNQYVVALCGCWYQTPGKERENEQFCGGMLFVDHASRECLKLGNLLIHGCGQMQDINGDSSCYFALMDVYQDPLDLTLDECPTLGLVSKAATEDNPSFGQTMNGFNAEGSWDANALEISTLQTFRSCTQTKHAQGMNAIQSIWAYKIKRFPDGLIQKLKAHLCVRGGMQIEGVDFSNTFALAV